jgi:glucose/arabinose dehydrogenase
LFVIAPLAFAQIPGAVPVTGHERLTWDQHAASPSELRALEHVVYLDGAAADVRGLRCDATPAEDRFVCSAALPEMAPGDHTLVVAARRGSHVATSAPLRVRVGAAVSVDIRVAASEARTADGLRFTRTIIAAGLQQPTDIAALPDGRLLVAERSGRVRRFDGDAFDRIPALTIDDCVTATGGGLLALAVDPEFDRTHHVYALYTTASGLRLARYVEAGGRLASRAIVADDLPVSATAAATLRIGIDRKLYVAIGSAHSPSTDIGEPLGGKILRLNLDGTTPADHVPTTPVIATGVDRPAGLATRAQAPTVWVSGSGAHSELKPVVAARDSQPGGAFSWQLPEHWGPVKLAAYTSDGEPALRDDLLLAGRDASGIVRVTVNHAGVVSRAEWIFAGELGPIHAIAVAADGSIVVAESDRLVRVVVDR